MAYQFLRHDGEPARAMLVDDNDYNVSIFRSIAGGAGIDELSVYATPKTALANIRLAGPPDVLFIAVPEKREAALEFCRTIRNRTSFPFPFIAVVAIMEKATKSSVTAVREAGVDEFLASPYSPKALIERLYAIQHDRRGFVEVPGYFGPDRRRGAMAKWLGADRRTEPTQLIDPITEQTYIG